MNQFNNTHLSALQKCIIIFCSFCSVFLISYALYDKRPQQELNTSSTIDISNGSQQHMTSESSTEEISGSEEETASDISDATSSSENDLEFSTAASESTEATLPESSMASSEPESLSPYAVPDVDYSYTTVDDSYFNDAVFIGDSRMQGFILYSGLSDVTAYTYIGLNVNTFFTQDFVPTSNGKVSASEALQDNETFNKVYLMFGINELGWQYPEIFAEKYGVVIDSIRECNPDAVIYVESILPVSRDAERNSNILDSEKIRTYNSLLMELCEEKGIYYLNVARIFTDDEGYLPDGAAVDGIHLNTDYIRMWLDYLKSHAVIPS